MTAAETETADPVLLRHRELERIAMVALRVARLFLECGAKVKVVHEGTGLIVRGLGVEFVGARAGYASHEITVSSGNNTITRMMTVSRHGVNHRLDYALRALCVRVSKGGMTPHMVDAAIDAIAQNTPRYRPETVAVAVGIACAAFGRLLGIDWAAFGPVLVAGMVGQYARHLLFGRKINEYIIAAVVAFCSSGLGGAGARGLGSHTVPLAMMASILLLVPGVPATNAQTDIMDGYPAMGSARAVSVLMVMIFATVGVWIAQTLIGVS
ncbi:MAG: threonine/serine exporter family protein [Rhizomicrobium sp.]